MDKKQPDSIVASAVWGRIGVALLCMFGFVLSQFGIDFTSQEQAEVYKNISEIIALVVGISMTVSKLRERSREGKKLGTSGNANICAVIVMLLLSLVAIGMFAGCGHQTATQQIAQQTDDSFVISKATYLDARSYYNIAQDRFIAYFPTIPRRVAIEYSKSLDKMGGVLDAWGLAVSLGKITPENQQAYIEAKNKLIDMGFALLVDE